MLNPWLTENKSTAVMNHFLIKICIRQPQTSDLLRYRILIMFLCIWFKSRACCSFVVVCLCGLFVFLVLRFYLYFSFPVWIEELYQRRSHWWDRSVLTTIFTLWCLFIYSAIHLVFLEINTYIPPFF